MGLGYFYKGCNYAGFNGIECALNKDLLLEEDNIGLRAICKITDSEVIEKAKNNKLRGWSFGFEAVKEHEEKLNDNLKRRFVDEMNLVEVSIIDERKIPCYVGTSIETRARKNSKVEYRGEDFVPKIVNLETPQKIDYSEFEKTLEKIKNEENEL